MMMGCTKYNTGLLLQGDLWSSLPASGIAPMNLQSRIRVLWWHRLKKHSRTTAIDQIRLWDIQAHKYR